MLQVLTGCPLLESSLTASGTLSLAAVPLSRLSPLPLSPSFSPSLPPSSLSLHSCDSEALSLLSLRLQRVNDELQVSNLHRFSSCDIDWCLLQRKKTPSRVLIVISGVSGTKVIHNHQKCRSKQNATSKTLIQCF